MSRVVSKKEQEWLKQFKKKVWQKLRRKDKIKLFIKFQIEGVQLDIDSVLKDVNLPIVPLAFCVASMNMAKVKSKKLIKSNPYTKEWMDRLIYDYDRWGIIREHKKVYGIFENSELDESQQLRLEQLLKSSISLDLYSKIQIIARAKAGKLSKNQLLSLIDVFEEEATNTGELFIPHTTREQLTDEMNKIEMEWQEIEKRLSYYTLYDDEQILIDDAGYLKPKAIYLNSIKLVKGQDEAVKKVSTLLYYQQKIYDALSLKRDIPFSPLEPVLISGNTGSGKSFLLETTCNIAGVPFLHVDCSSLVSAGIVGYSASDILKDLLRKTDYSKSKAEGAVVIFDEIDKLLSHHDGISILHQLLRFVEGSDMPIIKSNSDGDEFKSINSISTKNMLFFFAGSFQDLIETKKSKAGFVKGEKKDSTLSEDDIYKTKLPKELLGRIGETILLNRLTKEDYREILLNSENSPIKKYNKMLKINGNEREFTKKEIDAILDKVVDSPFGARSLNRVVKEYFEQLLFDI